MSRMKRHLEDLGCLVSLHNSFLKFAEQFYTLNNKTKKLVYNDYIEGETVIWSGKVIDTFHNRIAIYAGNGEYKGNWSDIGKQFDKLPFCFIAEFITPVKELGIEAGQTVSVEGVVPTRGDNEVSSHWRLKFCEVVSKNES